MFNSNQESFSSSFNAAIEQVSNLSDDDGLTRASDKTSYNDRYASHTFTYNADNYVVGGFGLPRGTVGGPGF